MRHTTWAAGWARCLWVCIVGLAGPVAGCGPGEAAPGLRVAVTVAPLAGLVDRLAPPEALVTVMIPPGASPVTHEPSMSSLRAASEADVYVAVGHPAFTWERTWLAGLVGSGPTVVLSSAEGCELEPDDPHVWLSIPCARDVAGRIADTLGSQVPAEEAAIRDALSALEAEMDSLQAVGDRTLGARAGGSFVVLHPAWGYLARSYGLDQIAVLDHGSSDAGPSEFARIVERARDLGLVDVLVQPQFSHEAAALVARELGGEAVTLDPLTRDWVRLYGDAISVLSRVVRP